jgi:spore maturation protein CgeB
MRNRCKRRGFLAGWRPGYHYGRCSAIINCFPTPQFPIRDCSIMYVAEGTLGFRTLDQGIIQALQSMTRDLTVTGHSPNLDELTNGSNPDLIVVLNGVSNIDAAQIDTVRRKGIKTAVWIVDDPYFVDITQNIVPHYDYIFTHERNCVTYYQNLGCKNVSYLPLAASSTMFYPKPLDLSQQTDVCFIGMAFHNRRQFFDRLAAFLAVRKCVIAGGGWNRLKNYALLKNQIRLTGIDPEQAVNYYNNAKIVLNLHRSIENEPNNSKRIAALSINPRTFEICACGALQLTDIRHDLNQFYTAGEEIVTYGSSGELMEKAKFYLKHEAARRAIAQKALLRTVRDHTYYNRVSHLLSVVFG